MVNIEDVEEQNKVIERKFIKTLAIVAIFIFSIIGFEGYKQRIFSENIYPPIRKMYTEFAPCVVENGTQKQIAFLDNLIKQNPNELYYREKRLNLNAMIGNWQRVLDDSTYIIKNHKHYLHRGSLKPISHTYYWRGEANRLLGNNKEALSDFNNSLKHEKRFTNKGYILGSIADIELNLGNKQKAKGLYEQALAFINKNKSGYGYNSFIIEWFTDIQEEYTQIKVEHFNKQLNDLNY